MPMMVKIKLTINKTTIMSRFIISIIIIIELIIR